MSTQSIGTCGNCGGVVTVPSVWFGVIPPIPQCETCKSVPKDASVPVIPMKPRRYDGGWNRRRKWIKIPENYEKPIFKVNIGDPVPDPDIDVSWN